MKIRLISSCLSLLLLTSLWPSTTLAIDSTLPHFKLDKSWGVPVFSEHIDQSDPNNFLKYKQWRFNRKGSTLYFTESECPSCKPYDQAEAEDLRSKKLRLDIGGGYAMLYNHQAAPALIGWSFYPKKQYIRFFKTTSKDFSYTLQFGFSINTTPQEVFKLEQEFFKIVNDFNPGR